jgi:hypothetical protein
MTDTLQARLRSGAVTPADLDAAARVVARKACGGTYGEGPAN